MLVEQLWIQNFRNIKTDHLSFHPRMNLFWGDNAQGKTNLLEAVYFCALGRSNRTRNDKDLIAWDADEAHIRIQIKDHEESKYLERIDMHIKKDDRKGAALNGLPIKKLGDLIGVLQVVIFAPEDMQLIQQGPSERRRFMDLELCQISPQYYYDLGQYYKILRQRNTLLKQIQKNKKLLDSISVWDDQFISYGFRIMEKRVWFVEKLSRLASERHRAITQNREELQVRYKKNIHQNEMQQRLVKNLERDVLFGSTQYGPHKDDILFFVNGVDVKQFGSQGQKRTAALSSKLAEIDLICEETGKNPILLLDDVFSELDGDRQNYLLKSIKNVQTFITSTGYQDSMAEMLQSGFRWQVKEGAFSLI